MTDNQEEHVQLVLNNLSEYNARMVIALVSQMHKESAKVDSNVIYANTDPKFYWSPPR